MDINTTRTPSKDITTFSGHCKIDENVEYASHCVDRDFEKVKISQAQRRHWAKYQELFPRVFPRCSSHRAPKQSVFEQRVIAVCVTDVILLHENFLQFDWLRAVVFQLNLKYLHVKITKPLPVVV